MSDRQFEICISERSSRCHLHGVDFSAAAASDGCRKRIGGRGVSREIWIRGGVKGWGLVPSPPLGSSSTSLASLLPSLPVPSLPLEVGPLIQLEGLGEH